MNEDRFPKRIYITNETGTPGDSDICDADTGKHFDGVFGVYVTKDAIDVVASPNWPITGADVDLDAPDSLKKITHRYHVKRLEVESW